MNLALDVETLASRHPQLDPTLTVFARAALGGHGQSPLAARALRGDLEHEALVSFAPPDARTTATYERETVVELGAVVLAGLLLDAWEAKRGWTTSWATTPATKAGSSR